MSTSEMSHIERVVRIAQLQKLLTFLLGGLLVSYFAIAIAPPLAVAMVLGIVLFLTKMTQFMRLVGIRGAWLGVCIVLLFLPLIQFVVLVVANYRATEILRAAGLNVGTFGVRDDDLARFEHVE
jgi:hypothetical protein